MNKYLLTIFFPLLLLTTWLEPNAQAQAAGTSLIVTWGDNSTSEDGFGIERKIGTTGTYAEVGRVGANVTTHTSTGLAYSQQFCFRVYAYNASLENNGNGPGRSAYSAETCAMTKADPLPATPGKPTVTAQ
jgi:hypothetical protein